MIGIETERGPWVTALLAAGYRVYAINPRSAARYRERHHLSGAKSDAGDASCSPTSSARPPARSPAIAGGVRILARTHQQWICRVRQTNRLPALREYLPGRTGGLPQARTRRRAGAAGDGARPA